MGQPHSQIQQRRTRSGRVLPIVIIAIFMLLLVAGVLPRLRQSQARSAEQSTATDVPTVFTETVGRDTADTELDLPGSIAGLHETGIYARTNGFVKSLRVDIGSMVRAGDTLAVLDMPDVAEQLRQARASLEQVEASAGLARSTLARWKSMREQAAVTPQEFDERQAAANVAEANVRVSRANVANLSEVLRFGALIAPFRGVVTSRTIDIGGLVSAGAVTGNRPLLTLVQIDTLRVMLNVPQSAAAMVRVGQRADVAVRELGDTTFRGRVALTSRAIDPLSRTLLTEVHVTNPDRRLLPGMFAHVKFTVPTAGGGLRIPSIALIVRADGTQVAQVVNGKVRLTPVTLGRDFGTSLEVLSGIAQGAELVVNASEQLSDGMVVKAIARGKAPAKPAP
ncbi:efflux RND transporter periplasmic adaptor subunit [Gemmatimonas groenlandica]|uniref:Efflux RND transporter periplasmic adaptor subunit n=1 Tax=Gemmatimonas groenlandica TaxID=2732249 RepID=A0A6M4IIM0_9BACT|nr:efflux RND transporter periplasmic adaptor subunit [Gemmatimonas groenlandica]QJR34633.1 efflux RND transporter periplasmic adaptor subunit [Gemmatimonas groenlandica]